MLRNISLLALPVTVLFGFAATEAKAQTITDIVLQSGGEFDDNNEDFDILLNAVLAAGLADDLATEGADLSVFAPNDAAFIRLAQDLGFEGELDEERASDYLLRVLTKLGGEEGAIPVLTNILLYHVAPGSLTPVDLIVSTFLGSEIETLLPGATITPNFLTLVDNDPDFDDPSLMMPVNIQASNGVIHTIDRVLIPLDL